MQGFKDILPAPIRSAPWRLRWAASTQAFRANPMNGAGKLCRWTMLELMGRDVDVELRDGAKLRSPTRNFSALAVYITGERDPEIQAFIARHVRPGDTFIDIGANVGVYTAFASRLVGPKGRVLSIEAHPTTFEYLEGNVAQNAMTNVTCVNCAVGDAPGKLVMIMNLQNAGETHVAAGAESGVTVEVSTVDHELAARGIGPVDYMKIDVEGFELPVLRGARDTIARSPRIVVQTELVDSHARRYGHSIADIIELMIGLGLQPFAPEGGGRVAPIDTSAIGRDWDVLWMRPGAP